MLNEHIGLHARQSMFNSLISRWSTVVRVAYIVVCSVTHDCSHRLSPVYFTNTNRLHYNGNLDIRSTSVEYMRVCALNHYLE